MKKVLIGLAAVGLSAAVFADVTSQNIVGYANKGMRAQHKMVAAQFTSVSDATCIDLTELSVTGYTPFAGRPGTGCSGKVYIKILAKNGAVETNEDGTNKMYYWYDDLSVSKTGAGWYTQGGKAKYERGDIPLDVGQGLWVYTDYTGTAADAIKLISAGGVLEKEEAVIPLRLQHTAAGIPFATGVDLTKIEATGYTPFAGRPGTGCSGKIYIKILAKNGAVDTNEDGTNKMYYWYDDLSVSKTGAGWYTQGGKAKYNLGDVPFAAGDGLWVYNDGIDATKAQLKIKNPVDFTK